MITRGSLSWTFARARELRREQTEAERALWDRIRARRLGGFKFRRQFPIGPYIADFCCKECGLVIELDGKIHLNKVVAERDDGREIEIQKLGIRILRFTNEDVFKNIEKVLFTISDYIETSTES